MKVDITPDVTLLRKSGAVSYRIPDALAELVDNSLDAASPGQKLHVELRLSQKGGEKHIVVTDDGMGMTADEAQKAMVLAHSVKKPGKIGEFGLGLKTACSNLGSRFEIITTTAGADRALKLSYDENQFITNGRWEIDLDEVDKPFEHGTIVTVSDLKIGLYPGTKDTVLQKFGKIFKHFVASGEAEIIVNNDPVSPIYRETLDEYNVPIDFEVSGKWVRGFATLLKVGTSTTGYGLTLIRHHRLISENEKLGFSAGAGLTRLYGELHLDDWPVNNNKTDFRRDTPEWVEMVEKLNEYMVDLKRESRRMANPGRLKGKDQAEVDVWAADVKEALRSDELQQDLDRRALDVALEQDFATPPAPFQLSDAGEGSADADPENDDVRTASSVRTERQAADSAEPATLHTYRLNRMKTTLRDLEIEALVANLGRDSLYKIWHTEGVGVKKKLVVTTNADHPFYLAIASDFVLWIKLNIVEAVAEFFTEGTATTEAMLNVKSDIMRRISQMRLAEMEQAADAVAQ